MSLGHGATSLIYNLLFCVDAANTKSISANTLVDLGSVNTGTMGVTTNVVRNIDNAGYIQFSNEAADNDSFYLSRTISGYPELHLETDLSMEAVWYQSSTLGDDFSLIARFGQTTDQIYSLFVSRSGTNLQWNVFTGSFVGYNSSAGTNVLDTWNHAIVTRSGTTLSFYHNGEFDTSTTVAISTATPGSLTLGASSIDGVNQDLNGGIALFKLYDKALTADEVKQNYNAVKGRFAGIGGA